ncbi:hypothetical protein CGZ93_04135 [Enemella dayhoffiae]|uniref:Uncharacterized protein n=1 Tax=Enemella dayhoffiae TaxID=2016507 RepID=A0A255H937_9ACTN|nr:hypothetical protein [Enemella dayhoffiae]OYO24298.1 hypothetical protein CGZ93_04135 [Enemella dayhoffiae]
MFRTIRRLSLFLLGFVSGAWFVARGREKAKEYANQAPRAVARQVGRELVDTTVKVQARVAEVADAVREGAEQRREELRRTEYTPADHPSTRP